METFSCENLLHSLRENETKSRQEVNNMWIPNEVALQVNLRRELLIEWSYHCKLTHMNGIATFRTGWTTKLTTKSSVFWVKI